MGRGADVRRGVDQGRLCAKQSLQSSPQPPKPAARSDDVRCAEEVDAVTMPKRRATVAKSEWLEGR
jgi:hypothetical protein